MTWLRLDHLGVARGDTRVLHDVTLDVPQGALLGILGPSGSGKTTLLQTVAGHLAPDTGTVQLGGRTLSAPNAVVAPEKRGVGWVPQHGALFPHLSVRDNVGFGIRRRAGRAARVDELLEMVGLSELADRRPDALSGGQAQRIALARSLAPRPDVILLDEPFTALDPMLRRTLRDEVTAVLRAESATAVLVTHDQEEALSMADVIALIRDGRVLQTGSPRELYERPATPWIAGFVGDVMELPGEGGGEIARTAIGTLPLSAPVAVGPCRVILRPEWVRHTADAETAPGTAAGSAHVLGVRYTGADTFVTLAHESGIRLESRGPATRAPSPGDIVRVHVTHPALAFDDLSRSP